MSNGHFVALSPKCYLAQKSDGATKRSSKGVPHSCELTLKNYLDRLYGSTDTYSTLRSLRVVNQQMSRIHENRKSLSDLFSKFRVQDDKITCSPLTVNNKYLQKIKIGHFQMWTTQEINAIGRTLNSRAIGEILTLPELKAIPDSALPNVRSCIIQPKHHHSVISFGLKFFSFEFS